MDFLWPATRDPKLESAGESAMKASLAKRMPHGFEVGYARSAINGRMLGHGDPIRVKPRERVLFHVVNGSATEIRSLALPGHTFRVVALDGNPVPTPREVPVLWIGTGERVSAVVQMTHPGVWILGDVATTIASTAWASWSSTPARRASRAGSPRAVQVGLHALRHDRTRRRRRPIDTIEMIVSKQNAAVERLQPLADQRRRVLDGDAYADVAQLQHGRRYRLRMRNASDDIHPMHLHRHSFELTTRRRTADVRRDQGRRDARRLPGNGGRLHRDNPGLSLFHCHMQLHMDYGFMALFDCR